MSNAKNATATPATETVVAPDQTPTPTPTEEAPKPTRNRRTREEILAVKDKEVTNAEEAENLIGELKDAQKIVRGEMKTAKEKFDAAAADDEAITEKLKECYKLLAG